MPIESFSPKWTQGVAGLIVPIQRVEFGIDITYHDQPDLQDITGFYQTGLGGFWLAIEADKVVGTIALKDIGEGMAAVRKLFVASTHRGSDKGLAKALLQTLISHAQMFGLTTLYLGTTADFKAAHRFYEKHDFNVMDPAKLPQSFPRMAVDTRFYERLLPQV